LENLAGSQTFGLVFEKTSLRVEVSGGRPRRFYLLFFIYELVLLEIGATGFLNVFLLVLAELFVKFFPFL
jgi:hypothetical protein